LKANKKEAAMSDVTRLDGTLIVNHKTGTIQFVQYGYVLLNITHLKTPVPPNQVIDIVALAALTSYNPRNYQIDENEPDNTTPLGCWEDPGPIANKTPE
jgi:hypothetical protein